MSDQTLTGVRGQGSGVEVAPSENRKPGAWESDRVDDSQGTLAESPSSDPQPLISGSQNAPRRLTPGPASRARSARVIVAILVVVAAIGYLIYTGFQSTTVYYLTVTELKAKGPAAGAVRVAGIVQNGTVQRSANDATVHFTIADQGGSLPVVYKGMTPDIFGPGIQVVVEGHYTADGIFQANTLLAKCPSKFTSAVPTPVAVH